MEIEVLKPIYVQSAFFFPGHSEKKKNENWNCPLIYFLIKKIRTVSKELKLSEDEKEYAGGMDWISPDEIKNIKFYNSADSEKIIEIALEQSKK